MVIGTALDDGATFFDDRSLSLEDFVPLFVEKAGKRAGNLWKGRVERRIVLGHAFFFFFIYLFGNVGEHKRFATFCCKDMSEYQKVSDYI